MSGVEALKILDAGLVIGADRTPTLLADSLSLSVPLADLPHVGLVPLWILEPVRRRQPVLAGEDLGIPIDHA